MSNLGPCVKVATDFLGLDGLATTLQTNTEFRQDGIEDVLSPRTMLYHAWQSLLNMRNIFNTQTTSEGSAFKRPRHVTVAAGERRKNYKDRKRGKTDPVIDDGRERYACPDHVCRRPKKRRPIEDLHNHMCVSRRYSLLLHVLQ